MVIVPLLKPGKDASDPLNYTGEKLTNCSYISIRENYGKDGNREVDVCQSGFHKGRNTMDSVLCLESKIWKAQTNKEIVAAVFFDMFLTCCGKKAC